MAKFKHKNVTNHSEIAARMYKKGDKSTSPIFDLRVSESEKYKEDGKWFKDYANYIVPSTTTMARDYEELKKAYEVYNNDLSSLEDQLDAFCSSFGVESLHDVEEKIQPYPVLHNNVQVLVGELLKRNDDFKIVLLSLKAIKDKDAKLLEALKASISEKLELEIEKHRKVMEGMSEEDAQAYIQELQTQLSPEDLMEKDFQSEVEIFYQKALKYCHYDQNIKMKQMETFMDTLIADRCFVYSGWRHGRPFLEVRNVLGMGYHKAPNEPFIHRGDYVWYKKAITLGDAYNLYANDLTDEELEKLGISDYSNNSRVDSRHDVLGGTAVPVLDQFNNELFTDLSQGSMGGQADKNVGNYKADGTTGRYNNNRLIWETHIEFKAYRKVIFLTYIDDYNEEVTIVVPDNFEIPKSAQEFKFTNKYGDKSTKYVWIEELSGTEYQAEILWVPRKYEVIRLNQDIYPIYREVPNQVTSVERPYSDFELSTKGAVFTARNANSVSLVQRAIPLYMQYLYVKHVQNRELSKYQGAIQSIDVDQIPDELGQDEEGNQVRDKVVAYLRYLKRTNKDLYSGSQSALGALPPAQRSPGSSGFTMGTAIELVNLQNLAELIDTEIGMAMGISPQRKSMFSSNTNVSDNQQAITQSHHITEPYFFMHSEVWRAVLNDYLRNFRTYAEKLFFENPNKTEHFLHYVLPDGTDEVLKIIPKMLDHHDIGVFLSKSGNDVQYHQIMLQLVHAFGQNAGEGISAVSGLIKAITSGASPTEIHKMIQRESRKTEERLAAQSQREMEMQAKIEQMKLEAREDIQAHEIEKIVVKALEDRKTKLEVAAIQTYNRTEDKDLDDDGIPDPIEIMKLGQDAQIKSRELDIKEKDLELQRYKVDEDNKTKREQIKAQKNRPKSS